MFVTKRDGTREPLDMSKYERQIDWACANIEGVDSKKLKTLARRPLLDGMSTQDINRHITVTAAESISQEEPNWTYVAARMVLQEVFKVATGSITYPHIHSYLKRAASEGRVNQTLTESFQFDFDRLNDAIAPSRDFQFDYLGIQTLADRYLLRTQDGLVMELPQHFFMRVAVGIAQIEDTLERRTDFAIDLYNTLSELQALPSTPTLFNSGTNFPQLSSCFGTFMGDDTEMIWESLKEVGKFSKYAGGCSLDVGSIRAKGSKIRSTGGRAGGPPPYISLYDGALRGFDQSGKRKGSGSFYIEPWHADIFEYLKMKDAGGDPRLAAHDSFPALWIPDLFLKRVLEGGYWSLFCPNDCPELHETYGEEFEAHYTRYEAEGKARQVIVAEELWHEILTKAYNHGVFWPCFKDTVNARYTQITDGIVHNSNLCTEITLRNSNDVSFVCNLSSVNLAKFDFSFNSQTGRLAWNSKLEKAVRTMTRSLDSVVSLGMIPTERGRRFQEEDRAVGLGVMGWAVAIYRLGIDYESTDHVRFSNEVWKQISLSAIDESHKLSQERGTYKNFKSSTWAKGMLPLDTLRHRKVVDEFDLSLDVPYDCPFAHSMDDMRERVAKGMRNSCLFAIAPTATISNIAGSTQCTELPWDVVAEKENLSGQFKVFAPTGLKKNNPHGLIVKAARDLDHRWTVKAAAARQIWIDQSQSTNFFIDPNRYKKDNGKGEMITDLAAIGEYLDNLYISAWEYGLKTTYYIYSQSAQVSKIAPTAPGMPEKFEIEQDGPACFLRPGDPGFEDCDACQ